MNSTQQQIAETVAGLEAIIKDELQPRLDKLVKLTPKDKEPRIRYEAGETEACLRRAIKSVRNCVEHAGMTTAALVAVCPQCNFRQGVQDAELPKILKGIMGAVCCPRCSRPLNPEIEKEAKRINL